MWLSSRSFIVATLLSIVGVASSPRNARGIEGPTVDQVTKNRAPISLSTLRPLIDQVISKDALLGRRRIDVDASTSEMVIDIKPAPLQFVGDANAPLTVAVEAAVRIEVIRRDLVELLPKETFWLEPVRDAETAVDASLLSMNTDAKKRPQNGRETGAFSEALNKLKQLLIGYAEQKQLIINEVREPAPGFAVTVKFDPYPVRVVIMPMLAYLLANKFGTPLSDQWIDLSAGPHKLSGQYHYKAFWPAALNGPVESNFEIFEDGDVVVLSPGISK